MVQKDHKLRVLGVNAVFHDPAAALVVDGQVVAAAEEERFTRRKHGKPPVPFATWELPERSAAWCLAEAGLSPDDLDAVAYSYDPALAPPAGPDVTADAWEGLRTLYAQRAPMFLRTALPGLDPACVRYVPHHVAHAASAHLAAPYRSSSVLVLDGRGEAASHLAGRSVDGDLEILAAQRLPHSGPALRGGHRPPRVPALLGRVQGDGAGRLREAGLPPRAARGRQGHRRRRLHGRPDRARHPGQAARQRRGVGRRARRPGRQRPAPAPGGPARAGRLAARPDRRPRPDHGRRGRAQLRGQLGPGRAGAVRAHLGPTGRRRRRHRPGRGHARRPRPRRPGRAHVRRRPRARLDRRRAGRLAGHGQGRLRAPARPGRRGRRGDRRRRRGRLVPGPQRVRAARSGTAAC